MCKRPVWFESTTNLDPGCPEMFAAVGGQGAERTYFGIVREDDGTPIVVVTCSGACLRQMIDAAGS